VNDTPLRVLVTGGSRGLGRAISVAFARAGHRVLACASGAAAGGDQVIEVLRCDVSDPQQVASLMARMRDKHGGVDVLVNNAGVSGPTAAIEDISTDDWLRTLGINLTGPFLCARAAAPLMKAQKSGVILNIATTSVRVALPFRTPYVASKAGLHGLTRALARELGPYNIRCNTVSPGMVDNDRNRRIREQRAAAEGKMPEEVLRRRLSFISMRSMVSEQEVADLLLYLASDSGRHVTGQDISVCGNVEWE